MQSITHPVVVIWCSCSLLGEYQKTCTECAPCPAGSFTTSLNQEDRCSRCSGDCRPSRETLTHLVHRCNRVFLCHLLVSVIKLCCCLCINGNESDENDYFWLSDFHLKVIQNCTDKSDVKCVCEEGYMCTEGVPFSPNCRYCERITETDTVGEYTGPRPGGGFKISIITSVFTHKWNRMKNALLFYNVEDLPNILKY